MKAQRDRAVGSATTRWLLLVHQLPASPSRPRVKTWRRLQQLGAVAIRNAVYVLPDTPQSREDFEWMKAEIVANRGEASVFSADTVDSLTHDDIVSAFREDRQRLYRALKEDAGKLASGLQRGTGARGVERQQLLRAVRQLRDRLIQIEAGDFFAAAGREDAETAVARLEHRTAPAAVTGPPAASTALPRLRADDYRGRTWLTRPRPGIDRSGSAWLIRRFIDREARFAFGDQGANAKTIPFDMYDVEFSHQGERCTFEVLCERFAIDDPAVAQLGRLVHDLDLKERRYNVPEAPAVGRLIDGLRQAYSRDDELLEQGMVLFEALYRAYSAGLSGRARERSATRTRSSGRKGR